MNTDWFTGLDTQVEPKPEARSGVWTTLRQRSNPLENTPKQNPFVIFRELSNRQGAYFVLKNTERQTYLRLSPAEYRLWTQLDGKTTVQELIVNHYMDTGDFAHGRVLHLIQQLHTHEMLAETPIAVWQTLRQAVQRRTWFYRLSAPAQFILTQKLTLNDLDQLIHKLYRAGGWLFFTRPVQALCLLLSVTGLAVFALIVQAGSYDWIGDNFVIGLAWLWAASLLPVVIHELGHALTVKHFGRNVPRGGLMLYFGMPAAFVETTDIWLEPRKARLAVTWNGPYTGLILGGTAALWIYFFPHSPLNPFLFRMAGFAYATVFFNANPLLKYDGYFLLTDALDIHSLRERSVEFVSKKLFHRLAERKKLTREERLFTLYGALSLVWMGYALWLALYFWRTRVHQALQVLLGDGYSLVARGFSLLLVAAMLSFLVLIGLGLVRLGQTWVSRFIASGGLAQHRRLAWMGGGLALVVGAGIPAAFPQYGMVFSVGVGLGVALLATYRLILFARPYVGSRLGWIYLAFAVAVMSGGLGWGPQGYLVWGVIIALMGVGVALGWSLLSRKSLGWWLVGILAGTGGAMGLHQGIDILWSDVRLWAFAGLLSAGIWAWASLRGGARAPAILLIYGGGVWLGLTWFYPTPLLDLRLAGSLLLAAGGFHLVWAQLPHLSSYETDGSSDTLQVIGVSATVLVRRVIAQVFFECGWMGVDRLGKKFSKAMRQLGLELDISGNRLEDRELSGRKRRDLSAVYGSVFDVLYELLCRELGHTMGRLTFAYGVDLLPWQNREVVTELILSQRAWGLSIQQEGVGVREMHRNQLKRVPLFVMLAEEELDEILRRVKQEQFGAGTAIVSQGDMGDRFYIIARGKVAVWQTGEDGEPRKIDQRGAGQYFGETALVSDQPRNATVRAETPVTLLSLAKKDFNSLIHHKVSFQQQIPSALEHSWLLRGMPIFDELESHELDWLALQMERNTCSPGEIIFREGDPGDKFYIIEAGQLVVTRQVAGETVILARRGTGDYVGEIALLHKRPRTATITAVEESILLSLDGAYFHDLVSGYRQLGQTLAQTGTRRLSFVDATDAVKGVER